jgi:hypothetical protein
MTDWQPIATAPKDGTVVRLLCSTGGANSKPFERIGQYLDLGAWREVGKNNGLLMPTHWAPYPE